MIDSPLVSVAELAALNKTDDVLIVDCRFELSDPGKGARDHREAHIPGAVYANLDHDLSDLSRKGLGRHPLPDDARLSAVLSRWGWQPGRRVIAYDDAGGALAAARLWWLLRLIGEADVQVLDGGWAAWRAASLPIESGEGIHRASCVSVGIDVDAVVGVEELQAALAQGGVLLLDARGGPRFRGEVEPLDRVGGHIPGAINRPFADNLKADGHFKSVATLRAEYGALLGVRAPSQVVHSCGSGVTACHNLLAMEAAGLSGSRVFAPSWSGWLEDPVRPVATGTA